MPFYMSHKTLSLTFFTDHWARNVFFTEESVCFPLQRTVFSTPDRSGKLVFTPFLKNNTCFSLNTTHFILNSYSLHFSAGKDLITDPCSSPGTLCLICRHFEYPQKYLCEIEIIFAKKQYQKKKKKKCRIYIYGKVFFV